MIVGFGAFTYVLGFILLVAAAIYVSPLICGTSNEKAIVKTPQEVEGGNGSSGQYCDNLHRRFLRMY
jgi:hypothetical protein